MDDSNEYVKMCELAEEIQRLRTIRDEYIAGDIFFRFGSIDMAQDYSSNDEYAGDGYLDQTTVRESYDIWLPRQDQLNNLIKGEESLGFLLDLISEQIKKKRGESNFTYYESMEQFLLSLLMENDYNKKWDKVNLKWIILI